MYTYDYDVQSMNLSGQRDRLWITGVAGIDTRVSQSMSHAASASLLLFDYHKKRTTGNDNNGVITSCLLVSFDYDLKDVTEILHSSLIPSSRSC